MNSQPTSNDTGRVQALEINGDTLIQMQLIDAKTVLRGVLDGEVADSLLKVFMVRDSININTIQLQVSQIRLLQEKSNNQTKQSDILNAIIRNRDIEIKNLRAIIDEQDKQLKKERFIKKLALIGDVALPVFVLLLFAIGG